MNEEEKDTTAVNTSETGSFEKIEVQTTNIEVERKRRFPRLKLPKLSKKTLIILLILFIVFGIGILLPVQNVYSKVKSLTDAGRVLASAAKSQNLEGTKNNIPIVRTKLDDTKKSLVPLGWLNLVPFIRGYYNDVDHVLSAGEYGLDAMEIAIEAIEPHADLLGLTGEGSFVAGSAEDRIQTAVQTFDKITPKLAEIGEKLDLLNKEVDAINPNRYPQKIGSKVIRAKLIEGKSVLKETSGLFVNARPFLENLPELLGEPESKRYMILFQNDKELRATGGFLTAYAIFKLDGGKPIVEKSEDIYVLDEQHGKAPSAPEEIRTYHKGVYKFYLRDSNISPDFAVSMQQFQDLYRGDFDFDGVITVDTHVLVEAIKILGTFNIAGREFSAELDDRCDCPKVVYELEDYATRPVAYVRDSRKDILGALLLQIMQKALGVSPSQYWGQLFQMALTQVNEKHILAYMMDEKTQKAIELLNMGGRIANGSEVLGFTDDSGWDYLHINDTNFAGAKSNMFVEHEIKVEYEVKGDEIVKTLTIDYKNPAQPSDCNLESGGLCLNGLLRNWVRIYVPKGSELLESSGSQSPKDGKAIDMLTKEDLEKTVFEGFLTVRPLGSAQLTVKYKVPIKASRDYKMLIQKQPGTEGHAYTIVVNGKQKEQFDLRTDQLLELSL